MPLLHQSIIISCPPGPQQQTCSLQQRICCCGPMLGQTDGHMYIWRAVHFTDAAPHTMQVVPGLYWVINCHGGSVVLTDSETAAWINTQSSRTLHTDDCERRSVRTRTTDTARVCLSQLRQFFAYNTMSQAQFTSTKRKYSKYSAQHITYQTTASTTSRQQASQECLHADAHVLYDGRTTWKHNASSTVCRMGGGIKFW